MSSYATIFGIIAVLIVCVVVIAFIQKKEQEKAALRQKIAQYRYRANQALTILSNIASLPVGTEARQILMQYALGHYLGIQKLAPSDQVNNRNIESLKTQVESPQSPADNQKLVIPNDIQQLKQQINNLSNLAKFIMRLSKSPAVTQSLVPIAVQKIMTLISESKICAYIQNGKESLSKHEYVPAQRNFTTAQQMLAKVANKNSRLQQLESELRELITSTPTQALNTQLSLNEEEQTSETEEEIPGETDELFGPKKKW